LTVERPRRSKSKEAIKIAGKKTIEIEGTDEIVFKCGPTSITLKKGGDVGSRATTSKIEATDKWKKKARRILRGTGDNIVKGGKVKINS